VIDWGCLGIGDPAADLIAAWSIFSGESREAFRVAMGVDEATWARGRGWALTTAGTLPYYRTTNPPIVARSRHLIEEVLAEHERGA
jgi:aminoglycoside phosphotransferase (APT) family kinase protein